MMTLKIGDGPNNFLPQSINELDHKFFDPLYFYSKLKINNCSVAPPNHISNWTPHKVPNDRYTDNRDPKKKLELLKIEQHTFNLQLPSCTTQNGTIPCSICSGGWFLLPRELDGNRSGINPVSLCFSAGERSQPLRRKLSVHFLADDMVVSGWHVEPCAPR
ncbi:hypothetical protein TNCV_972111 [Trichonephila clavipes]|nr:hypothetical protein TNCV_972111 [Trichonephila clavipes]